MSDYHRKYEHTVYSCGYMTLCVKRRSFFPWISFHDFHSTLCSAPLSGFLSQCDLCLIFRFNWQSTMFANAVNLLRRAKAIYLIRKNFNRGGLPLMSQILLLCGRLAINTCFSLIPNPVPQLS